MRLRPALLLSVWLLLLPLPAFAGDATAVIPVQRPAAELLPVLQPLAGSDVSVQAYNGNLVLHGPEERIAALRALIAQLDRPPRNLRISVRRHDAAASAQTRASVHWDSETGTQASIAQQQQRLLANDVQQLVLLEGSVAHLGVDREIPVLALAPSGAVTTGFLPLDNGVDLAPQVAGDRVRLEIRRRDAQPDGNGVAAQTVQSVLLLVPGVWMEIGAVDAAQSTRWDVRVDPAD